MIPPAAERVWGWFWDFDRTRNGNGYTPNRMTHQDIRAIAGNRLQEWEISALLDMDLARLRHSDGGNNKQEVSSRNLTPDLFDALFG